MPAKVAHNIRKRYRGSKSGSFCPRDVLVGEKPTYPQGVLLALASKKKQSHFTYSVQLFDCVKRLLLLTVLSV